MNNELGKALADTEAFLRRYVAYSSDSQAVAVTLWVAHTWAIHQFDVSPYLGITSPEKRSGKTRSFEVVELLVSRPWRVILPSEAVLFRKINRDTPTVLLDEIDAVFGAKAGSNYEPLRCLLNAGNRKGTMVSRVQMQGQTADLIDFSVFCPKAFAGIGALPTTVADRSILIRMQRRMRSEPVERFRYEAAKSAAEPIRTALKERLKQLVLKDARPVVPDQLGDRAAESWEPLLSIAEAAGGRWPERARTAAVALSELDLDAESFGVQLLANLRDVFISRSSPQHVFTADLLESLCKLDEAPWGDYYGRPLTTRGLSRLLSPYDIHPKLIRIGDVVKRGYERDALEAAWGRWLPPSEKRPQTVTPLQTELPEYETSAVAEFKTDERNVVTLPGLSGKRGGEDPEAVDPRDDLTEDSGDWKRLLTLAYRHDGQEDEGLYAALSGARCQGARLEPRNGSLRLRPGEMSADDYQKFRDRHLLPHQDRLTEFLRQTAVVAGMTA